MSNHDDLLTNEALQRIERAIVDRGPAIVQTARRRRTNVHRAVGAVAVVASVSVFVVIATNRQSPRCESWSEEIASITVVPTGERIIDIPGRVHAVASPGTDVSLAESATCRTSLRLERGRIVVHAKDLGGGSLRVDTPAGGVRVTGTVFAVEHEPDDWSVSVAEGEVVVEANDVVRLSSRRQLHLHGPSRNEAPLTDERRDEILTTVGLIAPTSVATARAAPPEISVPVVDRDDAIPEPPKPRRRAVAPKRKTPLVAPEARAQPPSAEALIRAAQVARRAGQYPEAKRLFEEAGRGTGSTAESAWVSLARMSLSAGRVDDALAALKQRSRQFPDGLFAAESAWLGVECLDRLGDQPAAERRAQQVIATWPSTAQARAAKDWLKRRTKK